MRIAQRDHNLLHHLQRLRRQPHLHLRAGHKLHDAGRPGQQIHRVQQARLR